MYNQNTHHALKKEPAQLSPISKPHFLLKQFPAHFEYFPVFSCNEKKEFI